MVKRKSLANSPLTPLYGLVLAGGHSRRMGRDKSLIRYHGKTQATHCFDLLLPLCEKVFLSNRRSQSKYEGHRELPQIHDRPEFKTVGPLGGILSAMAEFPRVAWLVLACDLPFVDRPTLQNLIRKRVPEKIATAYASAQNGLPEPLCAIYEASGQRRLKRFLQKGVSCPRKILLNSDIKILKLKNDRVLDNINTRGEYCAMILNPGGFNPRG